MEGVLVHSVCVSLCFATGEQSAIDSRAIFDDFALGGNEGEAGKKFNHAVSPINTAHPQSKKADQKQLSVNHPKMRTRTHTHVLVPSLVLCPISP